jgi:hypothetical protein
MQVDLQNETYNNGINGGLDWFKARFVVQGCQQK